MNKKQTVSAGVFVMLLISTMMIAVANAALAAKPAPAPALLDPKTIPKFTNQLLANIPVYVPTRVATATGFEDQYTVSMVAFNEEILPVGTPVTLGTPLGTGGAPLTHVWGYSGNAYNNVTGAALGTIANSPSATFIADRGVASKVTWINSITEPVFLPVDPTIHWADPTAMSQPSMRMWSTTYPTFTYSGTSWGATGPVLFTEAGTTNQVDTQTPAALVPHLHGAEDSPFSDGGPNSWWTASGTYAGSTFSSNEALSAPSNQAVFNYPNAQNPTTLWYHDHAMGLTRINVQSGLAGFYLLKDPAPAAGATLTFDQFLSQRFQYGVNEIPLAIQDRTFQANGQLWFPNVGINPTIHPFWQPEFFGNTIMVNGKVWPNLDVSPGAYRFRVLDGSNARFYTLSLQDQMSGIKMPFTVIGSDGGYLQNPATVTSLTMAPGERYDIIADFSKVNVGSKIILTNTAKAPFPNGATVDPATTGQVMQFTVKATAPNNPGVTPSPILPATNTPGLAGTWPTLTPTTTAPRRIMTLIEVMGPAGPQMVTLNGQNYDGAADPNGPSKQGTTEEWVIVNLTADTHPIHLHLATFQLVSRQPFQAAKYLANWTAFNGAVLPLPNSQTPSNGDPAAYLQNKPRGPLPTEMGWKDTVQMNPGEVTTIRVRFTQQDGTAYPFSVVGDTAKNLGYVWHCHIVDHEDNDMMRPYFVAP